MKKYNQFKIKFLEVSQIRTAPTRVTMADRYPAGTLYVPAESLVTSQVSSTFMLEQLQRVELNGNEITSVINFTWTREDVEDEDTANMILQVLNDGVVVEGYGRIYSRALRTPSQGRAGGAWLASDTSFVRGLMSFGFDYGTTDFEVVPSKWDASIALGCTTSHAIPMNRLPRIQVIPDLIRKVEEDVVTVATDDNAPNPLGLDATKGLVYKLNSNKKAKKTNNPDITYTLDKKKKMFNLTIGDGNGLATPSLFDIMGNTLQMTEQEKEHFTLAQYRLSGGHKGTLTKFDVGGYADEVGCKEMTNIYGEKFDPREVDILVFESCWKWADRFSSMKEFYQKVLMGSYNVTRTHSEFYLRAKSKVNAIDSIQAAVIDYANGKTPVKYRAGLKKNARHIKAVKVDTGKFVTYEETLKYFPHNECLRVANVNKKKDAFHKLTYQYLQSLNNIGVKDLITLTSPVYEAVKDCTTDINSAKALFGMVHNEDTNAYSKSLVSKATELMELKPALFQSKFVQKRILSTMKRLVIDQKRGAVMAKGGYHFITPEPAIFFYQKGIKEVKKNGKGTGRWEVPALKATTRLGLIKRGKSYLAGYTGVTLGFRSPLIHSSEVGRFDFDNKNQAELNKWYGHLHGIILMNSYDTLALRMGGADYDGDKLYKLDPNAPENQIIIKNYEPNQPLIVSPLEFIKAKKVKISKEVMAEVDKRTLQNFTGVYTNMGTFYQNFKYHVNYKFTGLLALLEQQSTEFWTEFSTIVPVKYYAGMDLNTLSYEDVVALIKAALADIVRDLEYKIVLIRIAQAGEIDFTKHGTRFALPMDCETKMVPKWLKDYTMPSFGVTDCTVEYGMTCYSWYEGKTQKKLYDMETPMQALANDVDAYYKQAEDAIKNNSVTDTMSLFLGENFVIPPTVNAIYDEISNIAQGFGRELADLKIKCKGMSADDRNTQYGFVYDKYTDLCNRFADRKSVAIAGLYFESQNDSESSFTFVCCYDGLVELLLEQDVVSPRIARIDLPSWANTVYVDEDGKTGYVMDGTYDIIDVTIPFAPSKVKVIDGVVTTANAETGEVIETKVILADGEYNYQNGIIVFDKWVVNLPTSLKAGSYTIKDYFGKKYIVFPYLLDDSVREDLRTSHYENRVAQGSTRTRVEDGIKTKQHIVEVVAGKRDKFVITGMAKVENPTNAVEVAELIKEYHGQCLIVEGKTDDGLSAPMVSIGGRIVGMVSTKDSLKVAKGYTINYKQMYGHVFRLSVNGATKRVNGEPLKSLEVLSKVETIAPIAGVINKVHSRCDLSKWYWNVEWKTFRDFGYTLAGVDIMYKPAINVEFAKVNLTVNGLPIVVGVSLLGGEIGIGATSVMMNGQSVDPAQLPSDFYAVVYRAVSYFYGQAIMK